MPHVQVEGIKDLLRPMGEQLRSRLPESCGYALFLFHVGIRGSVLYMSSAQRADMFAMLHELLGHIEQSPPSAAAGTSRSAQHNDDQSATTRAFRLAMQEPFRRMRRIIRYGLPRETEYALILFEYGEGDGCAWETSIAAGEWLPMVRAWLEDAQQREQTRST